MTMKHPWLRIVGWLATMVAVGACHAEPDDWVPIAVSGRGATAPATPGRPTQAPVIPAPAPTTPAVATPPPTASQAPAGPRVAADAPKIERGDVAFLRGRVREVHRALLAVLPAREQEQLRGVSLVFDDEPGDVNAFAACLRDGRALVALTDGILQVQSQLARARATDEVFGTGRFDAYLAAAGSGRRLVMPSGFIPTDQETDGRKRQRQAELLDEGLAFIVGHELAHHRLSHTGCIGSDARAVTLADVGRELSQEVPGFNQPNELAADAYGVQNTLAAGASGPGWKEAGALLLLRFFQARSDLSLGDELRFAFERTHPPAAVRMPVVEQAAAAWRAAGGVSLPLPPTIVLGR